jgi:hypothetical protein
VTLGTWYTPETWQRLRAVADDRDNLGTFCRREGYRVDQVGRTAYGACLLATIGKTAGRA